MKPRVAVIGAGWAGLAAAVELAGQVDLTVFEAGREPGGRARCVGAGSQRVDNGQHILLGAYHECWRLMRKVGLEPEQVMQRLSLRWMRQGGMQMQCPPWPAPWHLLAGLLTAKGLSWFAKWRLLRALQVLQRQNWQLSSDCSVLSWLLSQQQPPSLLKEFWRPLVLSALNTPLELASMQVLAAVLRDSLGADRAASDLLLPKVKLSALFPQPAWLYLRAQGVTLRSASRVQQLGASDGKVMVDTELYDAVIVAVAPYHAADLLADEVVVRLLAAYRYYPIATVYLQFAQSPRLPAVMCGRRDGAADWLFDRAALTDEQGLIAAVFSAPAEDSLGDRQALVQRALADVQALDPSVGPLLNSQLIVERRATFASLVDLPRPVLSGSLPGVFLAGDWLCPAYPATLEGAVRSGVSAATALIDGFSKR
ncbi:hydroxysqualene dehydroxylase HpnE [Neisseriaceae bacterium TC5R-5]|nr:hydroxysqualene dehydroxylase HpnE [Neisseriaceae bacterium TC5R-5]